MLKREPEDELLGYCAEHEIGVVCYSPMERGLLTDKFTREWVESLPESDHRVREPEFTEPELSRNLGIVEGLKKIAAEKGITVAQLSIAWVLRRPEVTAAIVGARKPRQIEETVRAGECELTAAETEAIEGLLT